LHAKLKVLHSVSPTSETNPYVVQLIQGLRGTSVPVFFSYRAALFGRYDVAHLQWAEFLIRGKGIAGIAKPLLFSLFLLRLVLTKKPVFQTIHNLAPHEKGSLVEATLLAGLSKITTHWIAINSATPCRAPKTTLIPHGHYRDWYKEIPEMVSVPKRALLFGQIRPYKGLASLVGAFTGMPDSTAQLRIAGKPTNRDCVGQLEAATEADVRITTVLRFLSDRELANEIHSASLIVLPYRELHNSGALLLALSLNRPVLAPRTPSTISMLDEVGGEWIRLYEGELTPAEMENALQWAAAARLSTPNLSARDWDVCCERLAHQYEQSLGGNR
jgi:beta-1,4-mannosyltransferase